jgi:hypothetical protein
MMMIIQQQHKKGWLLADPSSYPANFQHLPRL